MSKKKLADRLDWNAMLGFEQVVASRDSLRSGVSQGLGAKVGIKPLIMPENKIGVKSGIKPEIRIGVKAGIKPTS